MIWTAPPPSSVILRPPSMTVFLFDGTLSVAVTRIVTGFAPQLNVMMPPGVTVACSAANVQLDAVPLPTIAVGFEVLTACARLGTPALHEPFRLPAFHMDVAPPEPLPVPPFLPVRLPVEPLATSSPALQGF